MPFIPVSNTALVEARYTWGVEEVENTLWVSNPGGWTLETITDLAGEVVEWIELNLLPIMHTSCVLREVYARDMVNATSWNAVGLPSGSGAGLVAGDSLPNNCTLSIAFKSGQTGRSFRGRNYSIGMTESQQANSIATTAYINALQTAYENFASSMNDNGWTHVIASRFTGGDPRPSGITTPVTQYVVVNSVMDSQRRRLPRG